MKRSIHEDAGVDILRATVQNRTNSPVENLDFKPNESKHCQDSQAKHDARTNTPSCLDKLPCTRPGQSLGIAAKLAISGLHMPMDFQAYRGLGYRDSLKSISKPENRNLPGPSELHRHNIGKYNMGKVPKRAHPAKRMVFVADTPFNHSEMGPLTNDTPYGLSFSLTLLTFVLPNTTKHDWLPFCFPNRHEGHPPNQTDT